MKNLNFTLLAFGVLLCGLGACSSSNTDTTTGTTTTEAVTTDKTTARSQAEMVGTLPVPAGSDSVAARIDSTTFHAMAASTGIFEVLSSVQAKSKGQHPEVKKFADQMVTDHTKMNNELTQIASMRNLTLPTTAYARHQRMVTKLTNEEDADEFDEHYMDMQVGVHKQSVELFESAAKNNPDPEMKAFAARHLPHLRMHLDNAKRIKDMVK